MLGSSGCQFVKIIVIAFTGADGDRPGRAQEGGRSNKDSQNEKGKTGRIISRGELSRLAGLVRDRQLGNQQGKRAAKRAGFQSLSSCSCPSQNDASWHRRTMDSRAGRHSRSPNKKRDKKGKMGRNGVRRRGMALSAEGGLFNGPPGVDPLSWLGNIGKRRRAREKFLFHNEVGATETGHELYLQYPQPQQWLLFIEENGESKKFKNSRFDTSRGEKDRITGRERKKNIRQGREEWNPARQVPS